jgi:hypothetical protein
MRVSSSLIGSPFHDRVSCRISCAIGTDAELRNISAAANDNPFQILRGGWWRATCWSRRRPTDLTSVRTTCRGPSPLASGGHHSASAGTNVRQPARLVRPSSLHRAAAGAVFIGHRASRLGYFWLAGGAGAWVVWLLSADGLGVGFSRSLISV